MADREERMATEVVGLELRVEELEAERDRLQARLDAVVAACDEFAGPMHIRAIATGTLDDVGEGAP